MEDREITDLTAYSNIQDNDVIPIVDVANDQTKKTLWSVIKSLLKVGYTIILAGNISTPADATNYAIGTYTTSGGGAGRLRVYIPKAGTIKKAKLHIGNFGTLSTTEQSTFSIRLNNTTDITVSAVVQTDATSFVATADLSQAVVEGDYIEGKWVTPTWATNPGTVAIQCVLYIE